mmetsp:Transcript_16456/g.26046  ORF Transcript_16456/g.26046 Transcript_16456/m.26046 type:complete len:206 (+) Transcript_16456:204-821(+)
MLGISISESRSCFFVQRALRHCFLRIIRVRKSAKLKSPKFPGSGNQRRAIFRRLQHPIRILFIFVELLRFEHGRLMNVDLILFDLLLFLAILPSNQAAQIKSSDGLIEATRKQRIARHTDIVHHIFMHLDLGQLQLILDIPHPHRSRSITAEDILAVIRPPDTVRSAKPDRRTRAEQKLHHSVSLEHVPNNQQSFGTILVRTARH